ncbi:rab11 family-interacting protein 5 isoform 2-T2 [Mantella aurantiaca]
MFLRPEPELGWFPTHVQVTILEAKSLRAKGKHGTSDAYTLIQVGREKYSTSVVEKTPGSPEWKEECTFELSPGALERGENCELQLTVMHRALIGLDQFLGQISIPLHQVFQEGRSLRNQWYKLRSKPGKKEKERGEIQVSIQFTRNNLTASMFDLSMKDKPKTPFGKLKDKMKIKKRFDMESSSAIVPSSVGRLDSDEEEEKKPKSKAAAFFKGHLRKSSLTRSNTSLGSDSTVSSSSGAVPSNANISIVVSDTGKKPAARNSSLSTEPSVMDHEASPRLTHKRAFSDEVSQVNVFPEPKSVQNLKPKSSPISKSSVCINGSHVYTEVPLPKSPSLEKSSQSSRSFQNILKKAEEAAVPEGLAKPSHAGEKQERKPTASSAEEEKTSLKVTPKPKTEPARVEAKPVQVTSPMVFTEDLIKTKALEVKAKEERAKDGQHGKNEGVNKACEDPRPRVPSGSEERGKAGGWFGSKDAKDTPQKPSPHPVKPISAAPSEPAHDKKVQKPVLSTALTSGLELLKHVTTGQHPSSKKQESERIKDVSPDLAAKYYHLTHDELIHMLLQREAELEKKEGHMRELEDYIDKLLVRIMDQAPALLQAPLETMK